MIFLPAINGLKLDDTFSVGEELFKCVKLYTKGADMKKDNPEFVILARNGYLKCEKVEVKSGENNE